MSKNLMETNELSKNAMGGTELMQHALYSKVDPELLGRFQIWFSRYRPETRDPSRIPILYLHDLPGDPESEFLRDGGWAQFEMLVFVSNWQMQKYIDYYGIPWSRCVVMRNAIDPITNRAERSPTNPKVKIIYHTTPHRGLNILVSAFDHLSKNDPDIELDVYSSFKIYGWEHRDEPYKPLFDFCRQHPQINYHGSVPNDQIRCALQQADIFGYPSIWPETSCIALIEAMSAGVLCVHPNYGALYETSAGLNIMYPFHEQIDQHAGRFAHSLKVAIDAVRAGQHRTATDYASNYINSFYNWEVRSAEWKYLLQSIIEKVDSSVGKK